MAYSNAPQYNSYQQKQLSFFAQPNPRSGTTLKDQEFYNVFGESWPTKITNDVLIYLRKRPGLATTGVTYAAGEVRGVYEYLDHHYFAANNKVYEYFNNVLTERYTLPNNTGPVGFTFFETATEDLIVFSDGITLYRMVFNTGVVTTVAAGYPTPHQPFLQTIDGMLLMSRTGTAEIYNSDIEALTGWDFTVAEMYPDHIVCLSRYNNYLVAMGTASMELYYNAALTSGSPFVRNESAVATIGSVSPRTALQTDRRFFWLATTSEGEYTVWMMEDFKSEEIATPFVKEQLNADAANISRVYGYSLRTKGHQFYVLRTSTQCWVYDTRERLWHQWTYNNGLWPGTHALDSNDGFVYIFTNGTLYKLDPTSYTDAGTTITCSWTTNLLDFDTMNRKFLNRLTMIGNIPAAGSTLQVSWTDDDYTTYNTARSIDLSKPRPALVNMGYFRRRAFKFTYTDPYDLRLDGFELNYNVGVN